MMRAFRLGLCLLFLAAAPAEAWLAQGIAAYTGPIDATTSAAHCYSLRACSASVANAGSAVVNLRRSSDNETCDFGTNRNGYLGLSTNCSGSDNGKTVSAFGNATSLFCTEMYDQAGSNPVLQATAAQQPAFTLNGFGTNLPYCAYTSGTNSQNLTSASLTTINQAWTLDLLFDETSYNSTGPTEATTNPGGGSGSGAFLNNGGNSTTPAYYLAAGTSPVGVNESYNTLYSIIGIGNGASSSITINGSTTSSLNSGTNTLNTTYSLGRAGSSGTNAEISESLLYSSGLSAGNITNLCHNQRLWWGTGGSC